MREQRLEDSMCKKDRARGDMGRTKGNHTGNVLKRGEEERRGKDLYLFECALGVEQVVDHVSRHTDE